MPLFPIYIWCIFFNAAQLSCIQYDIMIGFNVKKCILKSSLPRMYWNVWVLWSSWQDWWLKIWIYIRTKKLLISPFASSSNQTYSLCPETKTVKGKCCYSYCCLRHKKHGLVKLYNNTHSLLCLQRNSYIVKPASIDICIFKFTRCNVLC